MYVYIDTLYFVCVDIIITYGNTCFIWERLHVPLEKQFYGFSFFSFVFFVVSFNLYKFLSNPT